MPNKMDTQTYRLKDDNTIVYIGTTNDLSRRKKEHQEEGKKFTSMEKTSQLMSADSAQNLEAKQLAAYRREHEGKNPKYNKDDDG